MDTTKRYVTWHFFVHIFHAFHRFYRRYHVKISLVHLGRVGIPNFSVNQDKLVIRRKIWTLFSHLINLDVIVCMYFKKENKTAHGKHVKYCKCIKLELEMYSYSFVNMNYASCTSHLTVDCVIHHYLILRGLVYKIRYTLWWGLRVFLWRVR